MCRFVLSLAVLAFFLSDASAQGPTFTRTEDVIYGRKHGVALTMDGVDARDFRPGLDCADLRARYRLSSDAPVVVRAPALAEGQP